MKNNEDEERIATSLGLGALEQSAWIHLHEGG